MGKVEGKVEGNWQKILLIDGFEILQVISMCRCFKQRKTSSKIQHYSATLYYTMRLLAFRTLLKCCDLAPTSSITCNYMSKVLALRLPSSTLGSCSLPTDLTDLSGSHRGRSHVPVYSVKLPAQHCTSFAKHSAFSLLIIFWRNPNTQMSKPILWHYM